MPDSQDVEAPWVSFSPKNPGVQERATPQGENANTTASQTIPKLTSVTRKIRRSRADIERSEGAGFARAMPAGDRSALSELNNIMITAQIAVMTKPQLSALRK